MNEEIPGVTLLPGAFGKAVSQIKGAYSTHNHYIFYPKYEATCSENNTQN